MADVASITTPAIIATVVAVLDAKIAKPLTNGAASRTSPRIMRIARSMAPRFTVIFYSPTKVIFILEL
jgi:hypothetical protein